MWEVHDPKGQRSWGWYVGPLLHRGRPEARLDGGTLVVDRLWAEDGVMLDRDVLDRALERHAEACGADAVRRRARAARA